MKTLYTSLAIASIAFTSSVSANDVQLRPADSSFESKVCYVAATQGLDSAYNLVRESDVNFNRFTEELSCNGKSLQRASRLLNVMLKQANTEELTAEELDIKEQNQNETTRVRFVTDHNAESQVCLDAVVLGLDAALEKHNMKRSNIVCNDMSINRFAKKFAGKTIEL
ncbi:MAG: hypothetical protein ACI9O6_001215 [Glaciecola sp.]|jgi:hypothetical protein